MAKLLTMKETLHRRPRREALVYIRHSVFLKVFYLDLRFYFGFRVQGEGLVLWKLKVPTSAISSYTDF